MNRRHFLTAGLVAATGALRARPAFAAGSGARRFVFMLSGNGFDARVLMSQQVLDFVRMNRGGVPVGETGRWGEDGAVSYGRLTAPQVLSGDLLTASALANLGPLAAKACVVLGLSSRITGGSHATSHGVLSSTRSIAGSPGGPTLDAVLAALPGVRGVGDARTPLAAMRVGYDPDPANTIAYTTCAAAAGRPLPMLNSTQAAWTAYVAPLASNDGLAQLTERAEVLQLARTQLSTHVSPTARTTAQVAQYRTAVDDMTQDLDRFRAVAAAARGATLPGRPAAGRAPIDQLRDHCRTVSAGLRFGVSNVAVIGMGVGGAFHGIDYGAAFGVLAGKQNHDERHNYNSHPSDTGSTIVQRQARRAAFFQVWRAEVEALVSIAADLEATPEPGGMGTMLDHTVLVYTSDNGDGHHSGASEFPVLLLGGGALGLRTGGRTVIYPDLRDGGAHHRQLSNLWQTLGGPVVGQRFETFGAEGATRIAPGPLADLLDGT
jgi:hypothetical protein